MTRREASIESALARWLGGGRLGAKVAALVGGPVRARLIGLVDRTALPFGSAAGRGSPPVDGPPDPSAAEAEVRAAGMSIVVAGSARPVRALAQRLLGGPAELEAPRPLTLVEQAIWGLAVAAGLADLGVVGEAWPLERGGVRGAGDIVAAFAVELPAGLGGGAEMTVTVRCPGELVLRAPPARPGRDWGFALPVVVGRCGLPRASLADLAVGAVITVEPCCELVLGAGAIRLSALPGAVEARVATEYVSREMALPDEAMLELTVSLGTTRMSLRQLGELSIGQVISLGRPLAGPYEIRAAGRLVGQGELVDIDGELGVRIVTIASIALDAESA